LGLSGLLFSQVLYAEKYVMRWYIPLGEKARHVESESHSVPMFIIMEIITRNIQHITPLMRAWAMFAPHFSQSNLAA
jgi:hypothetical protein